MHDGMQYDPIKGQWLGHEPLKVGNSAILQYDPIKGQWLGHEPLKVGNSAIFKGYLLHHL